MFAKSGIRPEDDTLKPLIDSRYKIETNRDAHDRVDSKRGDVFITV